MEGSMRRSSSMINNSNVSKKSKMRSRLKSWWLSLSLYKKIILLYSALFALVVAIGFFGYFVDGNTFIHTGDGWDQHYRAMVYIGQYLRGIARNFLNGNFSIPTWDFTIGEGADIITSLGYYGLGDPLMLLSAIVPTKYAWVLYGALIILRIYIAGLAFIAMCLQFKKSNLYAVLSGAIVYAFSAWTIIYGTWHPMFLIPCIFLPIIIISIERILEGRNGLLLTLSVFLLAISNVYFMAITAILACGYSIIRLAFIHKTQFRQYLKPLLRLANYSVLGVLLSAILLAPIAYALLQGGRYNSDNINYVLWPSSYYASLPASLISTTNVDNNLIFGMAPIAMITILLVVKHKKEHKMLFALICLTALILLLPFLSKIINCLLYSDNRWSFAIPLLGAWTLVTMWGKLATISYKDVIFCMACLLAYFLVCVIDPLSNTKLVFISTTYLFATLTALPVLSRYSLRIRNLALLGSSIISALLLCFCLNDYSGHNFAHGTMNQTDVANIKNNEAKAVSSASKEDSLGDKFYRYSGRNITTNAGITNNLSSTSYYWSTASPYLHEYYDSLGLLDNHTHWYDELDDRAGLLSLSSVKYYTMSTADKGFVPYGFEYVKTVNVGNQNYKNLVEELSKNTPNPSDKQLKNLKDITANKYKVYKNSYYLPIGYTYKTSVPRSYYDKLNAAEKESLMLQSVVVEDGQADEQSVPNTNLGVDKLDYDISFGKKSGNKVIYDGITMSDDAFIVTESNAQLNINLPDHGAGEISLLIDGLRYQATEQYDLYFGNDEVDPDKLYDKSSWNLLTINDRHSIKQAAQLWTPQLNIRLKVGLKSTKNFTKSIAYKTPYDNWYANRHNFAVDLGYSDGTSDTITITFPSPGVYSYDSLSVVAKSMDNYSDEIDNLRKNTLDNVSFSSNTVTGTLQLDEEKWLALSIPYSEGWRLYIDSKEVPLYRANIQFMAAKVQPGKHNIKLVYETPLLKAGASISLAALLITSIMFVVTLRKRRKEHNIRKR